VGRRKLWEATCRPRHSASHHDWSSERAPSATVGGPLDRRFTRQPSGCAHAIRHGPQPTPDGAKACGRSAPLALATLAQDLTLASDSAHELSSTISFPSPSSLDLYDLHAFRHLRSFTIERLKHFCFWAVDLGPEFLPDSSALLHARVH